MATGFKVADQVTLPFAYEAFYNENNRILTEYAQNLNQYYDALNTPIQVSAASRLLGRGAGAGGGSVQEISLGTGLVMNGTQLDFANAPTWVAFYGNAVPAGATSFLAGEDSTVEAEQYVYLPHPCVITAMVGGASAFAGVGQTFTYTLRHSFTTDSAITFTVTGGANATGGDYAHSVTLAIPTIVAVKLVASAGTPVTNHRCMIACRVTT